MYCFADVMIIVVDKLQAHGTLYLAIMKVGTQAETKKTSGNILYVDPICHGHDDISCRQASEILLQ